MQSEALIIIALIVVLALLVSARVAHSFSQRRRGPWSPYQPSRPGADKNFDLRDAGQQLNAVMAASFAKQKLLNFSEYRVFKVIETEVAAHGEGYRLFAQTNLGEILRSPDDNAYRSINSKRVDILLVDGGGWPVLAVEYQGDGHYRGSAAARDAIKKEALRKAGVRYIEVSASDSEQQIVTRVREQLGWQAVVAEIGENSVPAPKEPAMMR